MNLSPCCRFAALLLLAICFTTHLGFAQNTQQQRPCEMPGADALDFWIGEWDLTWPGGQGGTPEGETGTGTNTISRVLDECIIQEQFHSEGIGLTGWSYSAFSPRSGMWQQTWVDNQGSYLLFTGTPGEGPMELRGQPRQTPNGTIVSRMVWNNVTKDSFDWDYQFSRDGGETWTDSWNIHYTRKR